MGCSDPISVLEQIFGCQGDFDRPATTTAAATAGGASTHTGGTTTTTNTTSATACRMR